MSALRVAAIIFAALASEVCCFFIDFPIFTTNERLAKLIWSYDTSVFNGEERRVPQMANLQEPPSTNASLRVVYNQPFKLRNRDKMATFNTNFVLNLGTRTRLPGGDEGVAFILAADRSPPAGSEDQWLGIANLTTNGTTEARIVAVEFDTRKNFPGDVDGNHVGLDVNSVYSVVQKPLWGFGVNLSGMADVFVRVEFDDEVYVGFSGSKFDFKAQMNWRIKSWQFFGTDVDEDHDHRRWVYIIVVGGVVFLFGVGLLCFWILRKSKMKDLEDANAGIEDQLQDFSIAPRLHKFGFRELKKATCNFDPRNRLGRGGFGTVYKGNLMNKEVAVKRISENSRQGKQEFIAEVVTIGGLHHKNLVKLIGWCYEKRDLLLVYEYMPNGSLDKLIFNGSNKLFVPPNWEIRRNIICGVAEALDYLHNGCEKTVLHRDVKPSNIMLDSKFEAKLGDFGLARAIRRTEQTHHSTREIAGTRGYMAPETFLTSRATTETDVYAFGVLVLEVVCGRKPANPSDLGDYKGYIAHWAWEFQKRGAIVEAVDRRIRGQCEEEELERVLVVGLACCHPNPHQRPTINNVLQVLKREANPPVLTREKPSFVWPPIPPLSTADTRSSETQLADSSTELVGR